MPEDAPVPAAGERRFPSWKTAAVGAALLAAVVIFAVILRPSREQIKARIENRRAADERMKEFLEKNPAERTAAAPDGK
jgi:hypothetical protein